MDDGNVSLGKLNKLMTFEIDASNGASDCGKMLGSFELQAAHLNGECREYLKPMLFSGCVGPLDDRHLHCVNTGQPERDMLMVMVGGPAYRIDLAASVLQHRSYRSGLTAAPSSLRSHRIALVASLSPHQSGCHCYAATQIMENKMNHVFHSENPLMSIHDQGAGSNILQQISGEEHFCRSQIPQPHPNLNSTIQTIQ